MRREVNVNAVSITVSPGHPVRDNTYSHAFDDDTRAEGPSCGAGASPAFDWTAAVSGDA